MALNDFREEFSNRYQDFLRKSLVGLKVATTRFEPNLKYGDKVHRFKLDLSSVVVRDIVNLTDRTIDPITDSDQTLDIDQKKGTTFPIAHWEDVQAGPLNPGMVAGKEIAHKVATYVDASILSEAQNAFADFDTGNLTTSSSSGVPISLSTSNVAQMLTQSYARLDSNNVEMSNLAWVVDPYVVSIIAQHPLGKDTTLADAVFRNGFTGNVFNAEMYVSNNLTGEAVLGMATNPTDGDTITINGVVITFVDTLSGGDAEIHITASVDATRANLVEWLNAGGASAEAEDTNTGYSAASAADQATLAALRITATNDNTADTATIVAIGSGRLVLAETFTAAGDAWDSNFIHCYYGKKGQIDVVIQDEVRMKMLQEPKQDTMNILNDVLYGVKTFDDGSQRFLDVLISA
jgi:hypothetical protein